MLHTVVTSCLRNVWTTHTWILQQDDRWSVRLFKFSRWKIDGLSVRGNYFALSSELRNSLLFSALDSYCKVRLHIDLLEHFNVEVTAVIRPPSCHLVVYRYMSHGQTA